MLGPRRRGRRPQIVAPYIAFRWQIRRNTGVAFERREGDGGGCPPLGSHGRLRLPGCLAESCPNRAEREKASAGSAGIIRGHPGRERHESVQPVSVIHPRLRGVGRLAPAVEPLQSDVEGNCLVRRFQE